MSWQAVFYFLAWAAAFAIMMRFGCGAHVMGHGQRRDGGDHDERTRHREPRASDAGDATDPVCGMKVRIPTAKSTLYQGQAFYFCSPECRAKFEAAPTQYAKAPAGAASAKEHRHGC